MGGLFCFHQDVIPAKAGIPPATKRYGNESLLEFDIAKLLKSKGEVQG